MENNDFDYLVEALNEWLIEAAKPRHTFDVFMEGFTFGAWSQLLGKQIRHPLYGRNDLTGWQKDAVSLASDFVRAKKQAIDKKQELIKEFGKEQYAQMLQMADEIYAMYRRKFEAVDISEATKIAINATIK